MPDRGPAFMFADREKMIRERIATCLPFDHPGRTPGNEMPTDVALIGAPFGGIERARPGEALA